eukprot:7429926-Pyramimonas_sp.AAC.1
MSEAQKKQNAAGQRLCRKCAEERLRATLASNSTKRVKCAEERERRTRELNNGESVVTLRCSNGDCLSELQEGAGMSEAQKKHNAAGERLCRKCAEERENEVRRGNAEAANRKRKAEADAKPLTCAACGE